MSLVAHGRGLQMHSVYVQVLLVLVAIVGASVFLVRSLLMHEPREIVKQVGVWLGLTTLLPLAAWYGTSVYWPPPDWKWYEKELRRIDTRINSAERANKDAAALRQEKERLEDELDEAERVFYRAMFRVCYPAGLLAVVVGLFFPVQVVGAGLLFGGLATLTAGCYSYWDRMDAWTRFGSLLLALAVLLAISNWKYWRPGPAAS